MTMSDRGLHPDLLEDEAPAPEPTPEPASRRGRSATARQPARAADSSPPPSAASSDAGDASSGASDAPPAEGEPVAETPAEPPEWFAQVRDAKDPTEALRLLAKNLPSDQLSKDEVLSGLIGQMGERRARQLIDQQERDRQEQAKRDAASKGDLYALGELSQAEILERARAEAAQQASAPFMDGVTLFQKELPEAIQREVAGKTFGAGKGHAEGVKEYLAFITEEAVKLGVERELRKRESALRKSVMTELNGEEPVPERENGTPTRVREITDVQIASMSNEEYDAYFDDKGRPKPGVRVNYTRAVPLRPH